MNTNLHPVSEAFADSLKYSWASAWMGEDQFRSWLHMASAVGAFPAAVISMSAAGVIPFGLFSEEYEEVQDDLQLLYEICLHHATNGGA